VRNRVRTWHARFAAVRAACYAGWVVEPGAHPTEEDRPAGRRRIELLPPDVIDQIAAGEVVERPASVVKELVENALDAGATHVTVEIGGGGKSLVRVLDNGSGMRPEEVDLALTRHATSKLRALGDLFGIGTMGFRGEALPSIASVSRLAIITRTHDDVAATRIELDAGRPVGRGQVGAPVGTQVEVRDLLFNVPARQKFLKGETTEASHITEAVSRLAMAHPEVHVRLRHGTRTSIDAPRAADGLERVRKLLGARVGAELHAAEGYEGGVRVRAYLASPARAQTTARGVQLFVGRRWVRDRSLLHAVVMGYGELLAKGRYPVAVVFIEVPGERVDVNVHPQKLEVRFSDAQAVCAAVRHTVARAVSRAPWLSEALADEGAASLRLRPLASGGEGRASELAASYAAARSRQLGWSAAARRQPTSPLAEVAFPVAGERSGRAEARAEARDRPRDRGVAGDTPREEGDARPLRFSELVYLGQLERTYLVCERAGELVLVDQHAAHERVVFERLRERYRDREIPVQRLLLPRELAMGDDELAALLAAGDTFEELGFEVEGRDGKLEVRAYPADLREDELPAALAELAADLAERGGSRAVEARLDRVLATIACHGSARAGDVLAPAEVQALLASLDTIAYRANCPHGRPVLLRLSVAEIARRFGRSS
jgi:DNA mismatch repair protein MutL